MFEGLLYVRHEMGGVMSVDLYKMGGVASVWSVQDGWSDECVVCTRGGVTSVCGRKKGEVVCVVRARWVG